MPKKSLFEREKKRKALYEKYEPKRKKLLAERKIAIDADDIEKVMKIQNELQQLPRNSSLTRRRSRCQFNNRARGVYTKLFRSSRHMVIKLVEKGEASGVHWSSW